MNVTVLPFGEPGWNGKKRLLRKLLSDRPSPPFRYNDVLILVPSARIRRAYGRLFLELSEADSGSAALVPPEISTLPQFVQKLGLHLSGPRLIGENSRLVLLEGIVKECISGKPFFGTQPGILAPSLSAAIAVMVEELSRAGITPERLAEAVGGTDLADKPQVNLLIEAYRKYARTLSERGLVDPAGMFLALAERFDPAWLVPYSRIIIDGLHDADAAGMALLRKIAAHGSCEFLLEAPSPDAIRNAGAEHPLTLTKEFLARIGLSPGEARQTALPDDLLISGALFSEKAYAEAVGTAPVPFAKDLRLLSAISMREEVSHIAGEVKRSLRNGTPPDSVLIAFPSLDDYGPLAEEIFKDYGIPYNRALGRQLGTSQVATSVISLLTAAQDDCSGATLLRIIASPFLKFGATPALASSLDRHLREYRITGGRQRLLASLRHRTPDEDGEDILTGPLTDLFTALEPFFGKDAVPLSLWMERLNGLLAWSGLAVRVAQVKGPLNVNLQALRKLVETLSSLAEAGRLFPDFRYVFHEWFFLLKKTFLHTRYQVPPDDEGGVQVLGLEESAGHAWKEIYLGGLVDGSFPRRLPQNIFLPEATLEQLGIRTLEKARLNAAYHFYRLLLSAGKVTLTWPENQGERPTVPSPFLEELTPLRKAGFINRGIAITSGIRTEYRIEESRSVPELAKSIALSGDRDGLDEVISAGSEGLPGIRSAMKFRMPDPGPIAPGPDKREFRVTELDDYLVCPYAYYFRHVLGIVPMEEVSEDISPLSRGSKVHAILSSFYRTWTGPVALVVREEARRLLRSIAERSFGSEADTFRNRRLRELFLNVMAERFLDAEVEFWEQGMKPVYLEQTVDCFKLALSDGAEVMLKGKIDRIDADENGDYIIVDYKTGTYPAPKMGVEQEIFQLPVYAVMTRQLSFGTGPVLRRPVALAYYDLAGRYKGPVRDVALYNNEAVSGQPGGHPKASRKNAEEFETILALSMEKARIAIEGIRAGKFPSAPRDEKACRSCTNEMLCSRPADNETDG